MTCRSLPERVRHDAKHNWRVFLPVLLDRLRNHSIPHARRSLDAELGARGGTKDEHTCRTVSSPERAAVKACLANTCLDGSDTIEATDVELAALLGRVYGIHATQEQLQALRDHIHSDEGAHIRTRTFVSAGELLLAMVHCPELSYLGQVFEWRKSFLRLQKDNDGSQHEHSTGQRGSDSPDDVVAYEQMALPLSVVAPFVARMRPELALAEIQLRLRECIAPLSLERPGGAVRTSVSGYESTELVHWDSCLQVLLSDTISTVQAVISIQSLHRGRSVRRQRALAMQQASADQQQRQRAKSHGSMRARSRAVTLTSNRRLKKKGGKPLKRAKSAV